MAGQVDFSSPAAGQELVWFLEIDLFFVFFRKVLESLLIG